MSQSTYAPKHDITCSSVQFCTAQILPSSLHINKSVHLALNVLCFLQGRKDIQFKEGSSKVSGTLYMAGKELIDLMNETYCTFSHTNPMHSDVFPSVRQMESEVVAMTASMLGGQFISQIKAISTFHARK